MAFQAGAMAFQAVSPSAMAFQAVPFDGLPGPVSPNPQPPNHNRPPCTSLHLPSGRLPAVLRGDFLSQDFDRLAKRGIPRPVVFEDDISGHATAFDWGSVGQ